MDLVDKIVRSILEPFPMALRIKLAKNYHVFRRGKYLHHREDLLANEFCHFNEHSHLDDSWFIDTTNTLPYLWEAIAAARIVLARGKPSNIKKKYLQNNLQISDLKDHEALLNFACSQEIVSQVSSYLGFIPVLSSIEVWKSEPDSQSGNILGSQKYHLDNADTSQVKVFVNVESVDDRSGPLTFWGRADSAAIAKATNYGKQQNVERLEDCVVEPILEGKTAPSNIGPAGTVAFVDTSVCFHYGSRAQSRPRHLIMLQYVSPCRSDFRPWPLDSVRHTETNRLSSLLLNPCQL